MSRQGPWLAMTGGGIAWLTHLCAGYFVVALGCSRSWSVGPVLAFLTVVTAAVALGSGIASVRGWRRAKRHGGLEARALMFAAGALLAGLFGLGIALGGAAILIVSPCRGVAVGG